LTRPSTVSLTVYTSIRRSILAGRYRNSLDLSEEKLAFELGVSRTPVREALKRLQAEGFVELTRYGFRVKYLSPSEALDILVVRSCLEGLAARLAAQRITEASKNALLRDLEALSGYEGSDVLELSRLNDKFHRRIVLIANNKYLLEVLDAVRVKLRLATSMLYISPTRRVESADEHRALVQAILAGDEKAAQKIAEEHVARTREDLRRQLEKCADTRSRA
jgi:DNA-binding GntR family transcriptional regulator